MRDCQNEDLRVDFDSRLKLKFLGSQITIDAGMLVYRELDEAIGLTKLGADVLSDSRLGSSRCKFSFRTKRGLVNKVL